MRSRYINTSLAKALRVLDFFDEERKELSLAEISRLLGSKPGAIYPILYTLQAFQYLERDVDTKRFRLGLKILTRANHLLSALDIREQSKPVLRRLASEASVNAHLAVLYDREVLYLDREEASHGVVLSSIVGHRVPLHCTALGKVLMAYNSEACEDVLSRDGLDAMTSKTLTNQKMLRAEITRVRNHGYALDREEFHEGNTCVAAPVRNYRGNVVAAISISFATSRLEYEDLDDLVARTVDGAEVISETIGWEREIDDSA